MSTKTQKINMQNKTQYWRTETNSINNRFLAWFVRLTRTEINKVEATCGFSYAERFTNITKAKNVLGSSKSWLYQYHYKLRIILSSQSNLVLSRDPGLLFLTFVVLVQFVARLYTKTFIWGDSQLIATGLEGNILKTMTKKRNRVRGICHNIQSGGLRYAMRADCIATLYTQQKQSS